MDGIAGTIVTAAGMFAGTNVDDLVVLTVLFLSSRANGVPRPWQIWAGRYTGIAALVALSVVERYGHWIVPFVFMTIGALIVLESGVLAFG
ncbi:hypothetical protein JYK22_36690, partial [Nonomuraea sp. RK-328]|nr:hypothetical protein [Nonomuraea sp. RK-328]